MAVRGVVYLTEASRAQHHQLGIRVSFTCSFFHKGGHILLYDIHPLLPFPSNKHVIAFSERGELCV